MLVKYGLCVKSYNRNQWSSRQGVALRLLQNHVERRHAICKGIYYTPLFGCLLEWSTWWLQPYKCKCNVLTSWMADERFQAHRLNFDTNQYFNYSIETLFHNQACLTRIILIRNRFYFEGQNKNKYFFFVVSNKKKRFYQVWKR